MLSEVLGRPGPTHSVFDALAASIVVRAPGPRVALLGFAAGGILAPLRALGFAAPIEAVDLSLFGEPVFRDLSGDWAGSVRVTKGDALRWLASGRRQWDVVVDDLSIDTEQGVTKPEICLSRLPQRIHSRLATGGIAVTNLLPVPGRTWRSVVMGVAAPHAEAVVLSFDDYENRVVLAGDDLGGARRLMRDVRQALDALGSRLARRISARAVPVSIQGRAAVRRS